MDWLFLTRRDACMYVGGWVGCLGAFKKKNSDAVSILVLYYLDVPLSSGFTDHETNRVLSTCYVKSKTSDVLHLYT